MAEPQRHLPRKINAGMKHQRVVANPALKYCIENSTGLPDIVYDLIDRTADDSYGGMMSSLDVLTMLRSLMSTVGVERVLDVGLYTGISALNAALLLPPHGKVVAFEETPEFADIGRPFWEKAGVADKIDVRFGNAAIELKKLVEEYRMHPDEKQLFDFAFIDADKQGYDTYYECCLSLLRPRGVIAFDNSLWGGSVFDDANHTPSTVALRRINAKMAADPRVVMTLHPIGDGMAIATKL